MKWLQRVLHRNQRRCSTCGWVPKDAVCDYDWSGTCSAKSFSFVRDGTLAQNSARGFVEWWENNLIAQYETADGKVEIHGLRGGYAVFVGERMVQDRLNGQGIVCYLAHALQGAHYKLSKPIRSEAEREGISIPVQLAKALANGADSVAVWELRGLLERSTSPMV